MLNKTEEKTKLYYYYFFFNNKTMRYDIFAKNIPILLLEITI